MSVFVAPRPKVTEAKDDRTLHAYTNFEVSVRQIRQPRQKERALQDLKPSGFDFNTWVPWVSRRGVCVCVCVCVFVFVCVAAWCAR